MSDAPDFDFTEAMRQTVADFDKLPVGAQIGYYRAKAKVDADRIAALEAEKAKLEAEHMETLGRLAGNVAKVAEQKALLREAVEALRKVSDLALSQDIGTLYPEDIFGLESCIDDMATAARATLASIKEAKDG